MECLKKEQSLGIIMVKFRELITTAASLITIRCCEILLPERYAARITAELARKT